jgi:purine-cytosine permease-like protein
MVVNPSGSVVVVHPPSEPVPTVRLADDEAAIADQAVESHPALVVEAAGLEPTAFDLRAGRAARLFWLWFAANSSVVSLSLGAVLFGLGMSLRQTLIAIVVGVALSFLPLGLGTLAGKWSGQPMMVVSRAAFGLVGNAVPAVLSVISRVFWGGALLWLLASGVAQVLVDSGLDVGLGQGVWTFVGLAVGFLLAFVVAIFGYGLIARVQLVLSILTGLLVAGVIAITFPRLDLQAAQLADDGPWILVVTGVVLVFSFVGLAWVHSSADIARYQRTSGDGGSTMLWATFGATLPAFLLIAWGALLAASDPLIADGLTTNPLHTIAALLPIWYPAPLIAAFALGLLSGVVLTMYSGGFALQSLGISTRRSVTTAIAGILVLAAAAGLLFLAVDVRGLIREVATTIAVPVAAWAGIFGAEMIIRSRYSSAFDSQSLLRSGGIYPAVRWVNLIGLIAITALGFGLTSAALPGLDWQGYLFPLLGLSGGDPLLTSDVGVLIALVLGILLPLITAVPAVRRQERALERA